MLVDREILVSERVPPLHCLDFTMLFFLFKLWFTLYASLFIYNLISSALGLSLGLRNGYVACLKWLFKVSCYCQTEWGGCKVEMLLRRALTM